MGKGIIRLPFSDRFEEASYPRFCEASLTQSWLLESVSQAHAARDQRGQIVEGDHVRTIRQGLVGFRMRLE